MRPIAIVSVVVLGLAAGVAVYHFGTSDTPQSGPGTPGDGKAGPAKAGGSPAGFAMPVEAAPARTGPLERSILAVGSLRSNQSVVIRPEIAGRVARIQFKEGQPVAAGARLLTLDDTIARAEVAQARASLALSRANYQRASELLERKAGTVRARDEALSKLRNDEATLALVEAKLDKMTINAPFKGIIGLRKVDIGDFLAVGQDIANLEDIDPMKVDFRVPEVYLAAVMHGQRIVVSADAWAERFFPGQVYAIDPLIDDKGRSIVIRAQIENPEGLLRPGLFVRVRLILTVKEDAILIPEEALVPVGSDKFVFRIVEGKAVNTKVEIGERQKAEVQVLKGLEPGTMVVTAGQMKLQSGMPVMIVPRNGASPGGTPGAAPNAQQPGASGGGAPATDAPAEKGPANGGAAPQGQGG